MLPPGVRNWQLISPPCMIDLDLGVQKIEKSAHFLRKSSPTSFNAKNSKILTSKLNLNVQSSYNKNVMKI